MLCCRTAMFQARKLCSGTCIILLSVAAGFLLTSIFTSFPEAFYLPPLTRDVLSTHAMKDNLVMADNFNFVGKHQDIAVNNEKIELSVNEIQQNPFDKGGDANNVTLDMSRECVRMWPDDEGPCGSIETRFGKNIKWAWLISYPRSGNTWTRYLLEASTGIFTGSVYRSDLLLEQKYLGEKENIWHNTTVLVKTHTLPRGSREKPAIMLIRNPVRSILSYWNWKKVSDRSQRHTGSVSNDSIYSPGFQKYASVQISTWERRYSSWISNLPNLLPVYYEYLRDDPVGHLRQMLNFMRIQINEDRIECVVSHLDGRLKGAQRSDNPYPSQQKDRLKTAVDNISKQLQDRGFPPLPIYEKYES